ncbi:MAG TPA: hypothetical protein VGB90_09705 [Alphaproteobacteria bacterium]|jgi:hypothetical protein
MAHDPYYDHFDKPVTFATLVRFGAFIHERQSAGDSFEEAFELALIHVIGRNAEAHERSLGGGLQ